MRNEEKGNCGACANFDTPSCQYCTNGDRFDPAEEEDDCPNGACEIPDKEE